MKTKRIANDRGLILPLVLMAFVVLAALTSALLSIGSSEVQIASNHLRAVQAQFLAEAGLEHAFDVLRTDANARTNANAILQPVPGIAADTSLGGAGTYTAQYQTSGTNTFRVVSTGTTSIGGSQASRRAIMSTQFISDNAIRTNGDQQYSGSAVTISGTCGSVHTNHNLSISGHPSFSQGATATGTADPPGIGDQPTKPVPVIDPADFLNSAKSSLSANQVFQYLSNGQVLNGNNDPIYTIPSGQSYNGWTYQSGSPASFTKSGSVPNGTYYFNGNVAISGSGTMTVTILATGQIDGSGNFTLAPHLTDTLLVSGLDIRLSGTPAGSTASGLIAAHEQVRLSGNVTINGYIIAEDATNIDTLANEDWLNGSVTVTYNCNLNPPLQGPLQILSWGL